MTRKKLDMPDIINSMSNQIAALVLAERQALTRKAEAEADTAESELRSARIQERMYERVAEAQKLPTVEVN